jgi:thiamine pyrophosphokinase
MKQVVFVVAGGELGDTAFFRQRWREERPVALICADGGARHLEAAGIVPTRIVGDMDSLDADRQRRYEAQGTRIDRHSPQKDQTDTELALTAALAYKPAEIWIWGGLGHRVDHTLANLGLLIRGAEQGVEIKLIDGWCEVLLIRGRRTIKGQPGQTVSLLPFVGEASGITLNGFEYPLADAVMQTGRPLGISNRLTGPEGIVEVGQGCLVAVRYFRPGRFPGEER